MRIAFVLLVLWVLRSFLATLIVFWIIMLFGDKAFDIFLRLPNSSSELRSLVSRSSEYVAQHSLEMRGCKQEETCTLASLREITV